jgi:hypothetical protein
LPQADDDADGEFAGALRDGDDVDIPRAMAVKTRPTSPGKPRMRAYSNLTTGNPSISAKSLSLLTSVAPRASAVAAIQRSFSSSVSPRCCRASFTDA